MITLLPFCNAILLLFGFNRQSGENSQMEWVPDEPWIAAINYITFGTAQFKCAGALIHSNIVLTSATCVFENERKIFPHRLQVDVASGRNVQHIQVKEIVPHPQFNASTFENNIAIIHLASAATLSDSIQPIRLWNGSTESKKNLGTVATGNGASMVFEKDGEQRIRGIASKIVANDTHEHVVFTDVAKLRQWIQDVANSRPTPTAPTTTVPFTTILATTTQASECEVKIPCTKEAEIVKPDTCWLAINEDNRRCKILVDGMKNTSITMLCIRSESDVIPDVSDAAKIFENLREIQMNHMKLKIIQRDRLSAFGRITRLVICYNEINELAPDAFDDLKSLTNLWISHNQFKELHVDQFKELRNIEWISMMNNQFEALPAGLFRNNNKLKIISLQDNRLKELHTDIFVGLYHLEQLYLSNNKLEIITSDHLRDNHKLSTIHMKFNRLRKIGLDLADFPDLDQFTLFGNVCTSVWCIFCSRSELIELNQQIHSHC